jgi:hypothetical protein
VRRPRVFQMVASPAAFVAGPVIRKTSAAPGLSPLRISAAATGTEADAQTYSGIPNSIIKSVAGMPLPRRSAKNPSGTTAEIIAATTSPTNRDLPMSLGSVTNPYLGYLGTVYILLLAFGSEKDYDGAHGADHAVEEQCQQDDGGGVLD